MIKEKGKTINMKCRFGLSFSFRFIFLVLKLNSPTFDLPFFTNLWIIVQVNNIAINISKNLLMIKNM